MARSPGNFPAGSIPGWPDGFSSGGKLTFGHAIDENIARWWQENIYKRTQLLPGGFADKLSDGLPGEHAHTYHQIDPRTRTVKLEMRGSASSIPIWLNEHHIFLQEELVFEAAVMFEGPYQGHGFGKRLISNVYDVATELGLGQITLSTAMTGKYFWAQLGFLPERDVWKTKIRAGIEAKLLSLGGRVPDQVRKQIRQLLKSPDPVIIRLIADFPDLVPSTSPDYMTEDGRHKKIPLGMALLAENGVPWYGVLDLRDEDSVEVFNEEVRRRK